MSGASGCAALELIVALVLERDARQLPPERLAQQPLDLEGGFIRAEAAAPDVGDAVALAVLAPDARRPRSDRRRGCRARRAPAARRSAPARRGRRATRPLRRRAPRGLGRRAGPDPSSSRTCATNGSSAAMTPAALAATPVEERPSAIEDERGRARRLAMAASRSARLGAQPAAEVRPAQIGVAIAGRAVDANGLEAERGERPFDRRPIDAASSRHRAPARAPWQT